MTDLFVFFHRGLVDVMTSIRTAWIIETAGFRWSGNIDIERLVAWPRCQAVINGDVFLVLSCWFRVVLLVFVVL